MSKILAKFVRITGTNMGLRGSRAKRLGVALCYGCTSCKFLLPKIIDDQNIEYYAS